MERWQKNEQQRKKRPASSGGLSKTHHPVHNEACQNLLREASHQVMREANIPANIWELCKGSGANPRALPCLVTKQRESRVLAQGQTGRVSLTPVPSRYVATTATPSSHNTRKQDIEPAPPGSRESICLCHIPTVLSPSLQGGWSRRTCPCLPTACSVWSHFLNGFP